MINRILLGVAVVSALSSPAAAQARRQPAAFTGPAAVLADSAPRRATVTRHCERDRALLIVTSPIGGYLAGLLAHGIKGPWEGPNPPGHDAERRRWALAGAAISLVVGIASATQIECVDIINRDSIPLRRGAIVPRASR